MRYHTTTPQSDFHLKLTSDYNFKEYSTQFDMNAVIMTRYITRTFLLHRFTCMIALTPHS